MNNNEYYRRLQQGIDRLENFDIEDRAIWGSLSYGDAVTRWSNHIHTIVTHNMNKEKVIRESEIKEVYSVGSFFNKVY
tara:strand:- start:1234 stop:1467 length:234 start_codon:yes stop_codon:yes gene_type:complete